MCQTLALPAKHDAKADTCADYDFELFQIFQIAVASNIFWNIFIIDDVIVFIDNRI